MPKVILSSKKYVSDSVYLDKWIVPSLVAHIKHQSLNQAWCTVRDFIPPLPPHMTDPILEPSIMSNTRHFLRIVRFKSIQDFKVCAIGRDAECYVLSEFTPKCVIEFENKYKQRITANTVNTLFLIGSVSIMYTSRLEVESEFGMSFPSWPNNTLPILKINQCAVFGMDQVESHRHFQMLYEHEKYVNATRISSRRG
ncbi:HDL015Cp [Eremothecium sinecaudum]|uniref:Telomere replication protein EST3 n=1 Tax=Eremothecium sinecaudum TaxID=45286 RepID=A0A0X8HSL9_9SACH|nr:HDL015Cp [Eremothecium sinecaudum]AMD20729.1 HDL015Cp [Eremothecium sinecaudum]